MPSLDHNFSDSIAAFYQRYLVPLIFEPYAIDLAQRVARFAPLRVLEIAAGTGVVTRRLAEVLPPDCAIIATDLNQPMLDFAASQPIAREVQWRQADAMDLPFDNGSFDLVICQFAAMFFPDRAHAYAEARRVLRDSGTFIFSVWDRIEENEFAHVITETLARFFPTIRRAFWRARRTAITMSRRSRPTSRAPDSLSRRPRHARSEVAPRQR